MPINVYDKGDLVRLSVNFKDLLGVDADPTTVTLSIIDPDEGAPVGIALPPIVKDSIGNYHHDFNVTKVGEYRYEWKGTGTIQSVEVGQFTVKPSRF